MARLSLLLAAPVLFVVCHGCSVYLAAAQPDKVDIPSLQHGGFPRDALIGKLGTPRSSTRTPDGRRTDIFEFYEGSATGWKVGRAMFHVVADVFTIGLWEIVATPAELAIRGSKITARVDYDRNDMVTSFKVLGRKAPGPQTDRLRP